MRSTSRSRTSSRSASRRGNPCGTTGCSIRSARTSRSRERRAPGSMPSGSRTRESPGSPPLISPGPPEPQGLTAEDAHRHLGLLRELVEIESPSYSPGVARVAQVMARELEGLGAGVTILEGGHLSAELGGKGPALLVIGHTDTVWPEGTLESMPFRVEGAH